MRNVTLADRLRYHFDNTFSKGTAALIAWLAVISAVIVLVLSLLVVASGLAPRDEDGRAKGFWQVAWMSLMRTLDPGTMGGDTGSWPFLFSMLAVTLSGIFLVSTLIGVITSGIEGKIDELRKGRSFVVEEDHTLVLGWSTQVFTLVSELATANANRKKGACVVVLAEKDKVEMEDEIRARVPDTANTRVVCRRGSPIDLADLEIANPHRARSIVIVSPEEDDADSHVIKTILALSNNPHRRKEPYHIVAGIRDPRNLDVARMVGGREVELVLVPDLIARITVQTCRQSGLSVVYQELLDFGGDEIYFQEEPGLVGKTFGEALLAYEDSALIGLRTRDGRVRVNPGMDLRIEVGDKVIAISEDDDTVRLSGRTSLGIDRGAIRAPKPRERQPERTLILGWSARAPLIINELDQYVAPGSEVALVSEDAEAGPALASRCSGLRNETVAFREGDITDRATLEGLDVGRYDHVITLSPAGLPPQDADARTLVTLLHLRDMAEKGGHRFSIVSEMLDVRNRELAEVTRADDFIVSDRIVSLLLCQISENKELAEVFRDLFDPEGSEIYLKPAGDYVAPGRAVSFYTVVEAARARGHVAIGYRLKAQAGSAAASYGVAVNPEKSNKVVFSEEDRIVVVAED